MIRKPTEAEVRFIGETTWRSPAIGKLVVEALQDGVPLHLVARSFAEILKSQEQSA